MDNAIHKELSKHVVALVCLVCPYYEFSVCSLTE